MRDEETGRDARCDAIEDFCCHTFCHPCTLCQEAREIKHQKAGRQGRTFINKASLASPPPPPPPPDGDAPPPDDAPPEGGDAAPAEGAEGAAAEAAGDDEEAAAPAAMAPEPPASGGPGHHRAQMGAPACDMER